VHGRKWLLFLFGTLSRHWPRKTKEHQENFQWGQPVPGTRTESGICTTWSRKGKNTTSACRWHPACFTVGLFQTALARSSRFPYKVTFQHLPKGTWYYQENLGQQSCLPSKNQIFSLHNNKKERYSTVARASQSRSVKYLDRREI